MEAVQLLMIMSFAAGYVLSAFLFVTILAIVTLRWYSRELEELRRWTSATLEARLRELQT